MKKLLLSCLSFLLIQTSFSQCTPDPTVPLKSFKVSDTCAIKGQAFNSVITIHIPDTIDVPPVKVVIDSMIVKTIVLGTGTGLNVTYKNGVKTIKPKVPYCATIGGPTVTGAKGIYSTRLTGNNKITFSADLYRNGVVIMPLDETILIQAGLEIRFKIVDSVAECSTFSSVKQLYLNEIQQLKVEQNNAGNLIDISFQSSKNDQFTISCFDINGQILDKKVYQASVGKNECSLEATHLNTGLYFIEISDGVGKQILKFILE